MHKKNRLHADDFDLESNHLMLGDNNEIKLLHGFLTRLLYQYAFRPVNEFF